MCGLKPTPVEDSTQFTTVTPHVGVWIETQYVSLVGTIPEVTPHVGVWIET